MNPFWNATLQAIKTNQQRVNALTAGAQATNVTDQYGNTIQVTGPSLNQVVTIGASHGVAGVQVWTGIAAGTAGIAVLSGPSITTVSLTKGSLSATVGSVTGAALAVGDVIGAANVSDPSSGIAESAIAPGTTIDTVSGSSITLSQGAMESGTGLYCAAAKFILQQDTGWESLILGTGITSSGGYLAGARLSGTMIALCGQLVNNTGSSTTTGTVWATLPSGIRPTASVTTPVWSVSTSGQMTYSIPIVNGGALPIDSTSFRAS
jgi:hypothetical protein